MIRLSRCHRPDHAAEYFERHLAVGDHPTAPAKFSHRLEAAWVGPAVGDLGLSLYKPPTAEALKRLCRGLHPARPERLASAVNRTRAYYDVTICAPKTISLGALLDPGHPGAQHILSAHQRAAEQVAQALGTMLAPPRSGEPRVKKWLAAVFHHTHSRETDPHLHTHVVLPNLMQDERGQWRAVQVVIAGLNRLHLEMIYGQYLARCLRRFFARPRTGHARERPAGV